MRKTICAIFAHPDDESFGPGGTLALLARNNDVYLLCATRGGAGENHSRSKKTIETKRSQELRRAAAILGVRGVIFLDFADGSLANHNYHQLVEKIQKQIAKLKPSVLLTYEPRGVSGHIDHIVVSMATSFVFYRHAFIKQLYYFCLSKEQRGSKQDYFVYFPPGYSENEVSHTFDISAVHEQKIRAMRAHTSQIKDVRLMVARQSSLGAVEHFIILDK